MAKLTLQALAKRVEALEMALAAGGPARQPKDWRRVVGMFGDSEFMRKVDEKCLRMRESERKLARRGESRE